MYIVVTVLIIIIAILIYGCFNLLKQVEKLELGVVTIADEYQMIFDEIREKVLQTEIRLKEIDIKGSFEADDEVGFVFKDVLEEVALSYDMHIGRVIKSPLEDLVRFHLEEL